MGDDVSPDVHLLVGMPIVPMGGMGEIGGPTGLAPGDRQIMGMMGEVGYWTLDAVLALLQRP